MLFQTRIFEGNWNHNTILKQYINTHVAMAVRINPQEWNNGIAMRWEIYGCSGIMDNNVSKYA